MAQEYKDICIIGAGASGCICAYYLLKAGFEVTLFDFGLPLRTLLPTGGGRCNLANAEYDFKELAKNYPRGEKFLYSVFSRFSTYETLELFKEFGVVTYEQEDKRIFPVSNSSKDVRNAILSKIKSAKFVKEKVVKINPKDNGFIINTEHAEYLFSHCVISSGGRGQIKGINHRVTGQFPALVGLNTKENFDSLSGLVVNNVYSSDCNISGNILFTHFGISGPLIYKISSVFASRSFPYTLNFDLLRQNFDFQKELDTNSHKNVKNVLSKYLPEKLSKYIACDYAETKAHKIDGNTRDLILSKIHNFTVNITGTNKGEETVIAGGYDLKEINPKTMQSKIHKNLYFTGEVLDIDGFCGGFNLQNAWSTAFIAAMAIIEA